MSGNEDLFVKLSMSAISLLFKSVDPLNELPAECDSSSQDTYRNTLVSLSVTLKPIGSSVSIIPRPAQDITLRFHGFDQVSKDTDAPIYDYSLAFGAGRGGQTRGEFYFLNVPEGMYTLNFGIIVRSKANASCGTRRLQTIDPSYLLASVDLVLEILISDIKTDIMSRQKIRKRTRRKIQKKLLV